MWLYVISKIYFNIHEKSNLYHKDPREISKSKKIILIFCILLQVKQKHAPLKKFVHPYEVIMLYAFFSENALDCSFYFLVCLRLIIVIGFRCGKCIIDKWIHFLILNMRYIEYSIYCNRYFDISSSRFVYRTLLFRQFTWTIFHFLELVKLTLMWLINYLVEKNEKT